MMKKAVCVLFLGCTALVCRSAVQSNFLSLESQALAKYPELRSTLRAWGFSLPAATPEAPALPSATTISTPSASTLLSKAETLALIADTAAKYQVPPAFVASIVAAESQFDCSAVSPKGAVGLMQLMPSTAQQFGADPAVPAQNIEAGTRYLRWLMDRYQKKRNYLHHVIAAYNAGPGMVDRYRGIPPFRETRAYVTRVLRFFKEFSRTQREEIAYSKRRR
jgi:soluble lytic murein transglycosylase-like protein